MTEIFIANSSEVGEAERRIVQHGEQEIGVVRVNGSLHAFLNVCPHQGGPVCLGMLINRVEEVLDEDKKYKGMAFSEDMNLVCPWHGWEFDVASGRCAGDGRKGLKKFPVVVKEGGIYVLAE